jgi:GNAT superfamily N-acetyltransferase
MVTTGARTITFMEIVPFGAAHDDAVSRLVARAVHAARRAEPLLPPGWGRPEPYGAQLKVIRERGSGVALVEGGRCLGFLAGFEVSRASGDRWVYTPEWGWAATARRRPGRERERLIQDLYAAAAAAWVDAGFRAHYVSVLANDRAGLRAWSWLGFGHSVMDGIRDLASVPGDRSAAIRVRPAAPTEARTLGELEDGLRGHLAGSPVFFALGPARSLADQRRRIAEPEAAVLFAEVAGRVVGYLVVGPASDDAATVIRDAGTASISGAFVRPEHRRGGVADALLDSAVSWARERGHERIAVDFETANLLATRFWTRHFRPVTHSLARRL